MEQNKPLQELTDEQLVDRFFAEQMQTPLPDDGFSTRVIEQLPAPPSHINSLWALICLIAGVVYFFAIDGLGLIGKLLRDGGLQIVNSLATAQLHTSTLVGLYVAGIVVMLLIARDFTAELRHEL